MLTTCNKKEVTKGERFAYLDSVALIKKYSTIKDVNLKYDSILEQKQIQFVNEVKSIENLDSQKQKIHQLYQEQQIFLDQMHQEKIVKIDSLNKKIKEIVEKFCKQKKYKLLKINDKNFQSKAKIDITKDILKLLNTKKIVSTVKPLEISKNSSQVIQKENANTSITSPNYYKIAKKHHKKRFFIAKKHPNTIKNQDSIYKTDLDTLVNPVTETKKKSYLPKNKIKKLNADSLVNPVTETKKKNYLPKNKIKKLNADSLVNPVAKTKEKNYLPKSKGAKSSFDTAKTNPDVVKTNIETEQAYNLKEKAITEAINEKEQIKFEKEIVEAKPKVDTVISIKKKKSLISEYENADVDNANLKNEADYEELEAYNTMANILINKFGESTDRQQELLIKLDSTATIAESNRSKSTFLWGSPEYKKIEAIKKELDIINKNQNKILFQFDNLYSERFKKIPNSGDLVNKSYTIAINNLKERQSKSEQLNTSLLNVLDKIKEEVDTGISKKPKIQQLTLETETDRYNKDRVKLIQIKTNTPVTSDTPKPEDFDYGDETQIFTQIFKNVTNLTNGYYLILAVHNDTEKRDAFVTKVVSTGQTNIDFFYDISSNNYFIYSEKYEDIKTAVKALQSKGNKPYNSKMTLVKIDNKQDL